MKNQNQDVSCQDVSWEGRCTSPWVFFTVKMAPNRAKHDKCFVLGFTKNGLRWFANLSRAKISNI